MASRGRRGRAPAREDEPRRDERAEQQAPALQGPVLPPPPPVDYGVFMQGLVQAMQTQAHTQAQVPAQDHGGPSTMERFKRMLSPSFKGESDPLLAESCMREIEKIFRAIRCADDDKVTLATYMLQADLIFTFAGLRNSRIRVGGGAGGAGASSRSSVRPLDVSTRAPDADEISSFSTRLPDLSSTMCRREEREGGGRPGREREEGGG
ncbi:hypothetical protein Taro_051360 [Colocasia esculenta]|uniref:Uncharacterized protein n=1 Tax=Colocasia esculenta TaxID=4460 RepID=A0A843XGL2_COLES|nr:hypothetical protein [Colocasia esculenta]